MLFSKERLQIEAPPPLAGDKGGGHTGVDFKALTGSSSGAVPRASACFLLKRNLFEAGERVALGIAGHDGAP